MEPGDVILVLQQKDHDFFTRQGDDLFMTKKIHLAEALCGFHMVIKHLDKRDLVIKYPAGQVIEPGNNDTILAEHLSEKICYPGKKVQ